MPNPVNTWADIEAYKTTAKKLAQEFLKAFDKACGDKNIKESVIKECPGK